MRLLTVLIILCACGDTTEDGSDATTDIAVRDAASGADAGCATGQGCVHSVSPSLVGRGLSRSSLIDGDILHAVGPAGLETFDLTMGPDPVGSLAMGTGDLDWLDVAGVGERLFIVAQRADDPEGSRRLRIVDVTTPSEPALVDTLDLPSGSRIYVSGDNLLVWGFAAAEVHVIAIDSGAELLGTIMLPASRVADILPRGDTLFFSTITDASGLDVVAMNISDPTSPQVIGTVRAGDLIRGGITRGKMMALDADHLLVFGPHFNGAVISIADPANMSVVSARVDLQSAGAAYPDDLVDADEEGRGYFVRSGRVGAIDARTPSMPVFSMVPDAPDVPEVGYRGVAVQDGVVSVVTNAGVQRFDFTDFANPRALSTIDVTLDRLRPVDRAVVSGSTVHVVDGSLVRSFAVCGTEPPTEIGSPLSSEAFDIQSRGNLVALADSSFDIRLFEVGDNGEARARGTIPADQPDLFPAAFALAESALVVIVESELRVYPLGASGVGAEPTSRIEIPFSPWRVVAAGDVIIAAGGAPSGGLLARVDLSDPDLSVSMHSVPEGFFTLASTNDRVTIGDDTGTWLLDPDRIDEAVLSGPPWVPAPDVLPFPDGLRAIDPMLRIWDPADTTTFVTDLRGEGRLYGFTDDGRVVVGDQLFRVVDPSCP